MKEHLKFICKYAKDDVKEFINNLTPIGLAKLTSQVIAVISGVGLWVTRDWWWGVGILVAFSIPIIWYAIFGGEDDG